MIKEELLADQKMNLKRSDFNPDIHSCFHPNFLKFQLNLSLSRLGLETIDCVILSNPYETCLAYMTILEYKKNFAKIVEQYERFVQEGKIRYYGLTAARSLLTHPLVLKIHCEEANISIEKSQQQLYETQLLVESVAGKDNHFKFVQTPFSYG